MSSSTKFSLLVYAPVLIALLLLALFLLPASVLITLISIFDPTVPFSTAISYGIWVIAPIVAVVSLFLFGRWLHVYSLGGHSSRIVWAIIWVVFSLALFIVIWMVLSILSSIGASDTPARTFFGRTALIAAILTLPSQVFMIPWLYAVSRILPGALRQSGQLENLHSSRSS